MRSPPERAAGAAAIRALAGALCALAASGCYHIRTHDPAPPISKPKALAAHVTERLDKRDLRVGRGARVLLLYDPPEVNELGRGEALCADLVPLWPYARGEWPAPEVTGLAPVLEGILRPYFLSAAEGGAGGGDADLALELSFTQGTYRRYTRTRYGLSLYGWISNVLGYPTAFATTRLEADLRVLDARRGEPGAPALFERRVDGVETSQSGAFLFFFPYNIMQKLILVYGPQPVAWSDVTAEAIEDFADDLLDALEEAFPIRCFACRLDYEKDAKRCDKCGGALSPRED